MVTGRGLISRGRLKELQLPNSVYIITFCGIDGCTCKEAEKGCSRGFFSLFLQAVNGIAFAERNGLPYYVSFGNRKSLYSDPGKEEQNFWNYYFNQPIPLLSEEVKQVNNLNIEVHPLRIWSKKHFLYLHREVVKNLRFQNDVQEILEANRNVFVKNKVLGVQIRCTDHATEVQPVCLERIFEEIAKQITEFDKLFVATDNNFVISSLQERYGEKLVCHAAERSDNDMAVHLNSSIKDRYKLGLDVLVDCYCLSLCKQVILVHSNISYAALLFNPELPYTLLERPKEKRKRLKTLFLYNLDRFGIRKW